MNRILPFYQLRCWKCGEEFPGDYILGHWDDTGHFPDNWPVDESLNFKMQIDADPCILQELKKNIKDFEKEQKHLLKEMYESRCGMMLELYTATELKRQKQEKRTNGKQVFWLPRD